MVICRQYLKDPQVKLFAMFTGMVPEDYLGHEPWQFLLKVIFCVRLLMDVNWKLLIKAWPTDRGAPFPAAAIMDLLANLYNAENPTELNVWPSHSFYSSISWNWSGCALITMDWASYSTPKFGDHHSEIMEISNQA